MNLVMSKLASEFMDYLAAYQSGATNGSFAGQDLSHLPPLSEVEQTTWVKCCNLARTLEAAKAIGLVDVRPRTGNSAALILVLPCCSPKFIFMRSQSIGIISWLIPT